MNNMNMIIDNNKNIQLNNWNMNMTMVKRQVSPIEKFKVLQEGGKSVEHYNIKVGFKIRMFLCK